MIDLMSLGEQVDRDFALARRVRLRRLRAFLFKRATRGTLLDFEEIRRDFRVADGLDRGKSSIEISRIIGSAGKHDQFDEQFMPLARASAKRWKRIERAFQSGVELPPVPPVSLYKLNSDYFVKDGHNRVSVSRFHGGEWIDAEVTEFKTSVDRRLASPSEAERLPPMVAGMSLGLA